MEPLARVATIQAQNLYIVERAPSASQSIGALSVARRLRTISTARRSLVRRRPSG
jgi:hypothetical protein